MSQRLRHHYPEILGERRYHDDVGQLQHALFFFTADIAKHRDLTAELQSIDLAAKFCFVQREYVWRIRHQPC